MEALTLYELNNRVKLALKNSFTERYWITAEITEIQLNSSGHCYLQLADKKEGEESIVATARATIWAFVFRTLRPYFETMTGRPLTKGIKVMLAVEVVFHEVYGYSLNVRDMDPTYTVGDLERKKREILTQLEEEGIIDMNRELEFPLLPKSVAVISSPTAAGWGDFQNHLNSNPYGYHFHVRLFPAIMQGEKAADSVIAALDRIYEYEDLFDVVVIIRGGGSQTDLGCFDSYDIAANIAQFPLPVISGIGHERDETLVDRVAHLRVKTPTAAAAFLISAFQEREGELETMKHDFVSGVQQMLHEEHTRQLRYVSDLKRFTGRLLSGNSSRLQLLSRHMQQAGQTCIRQEMYVFEQLKDRMASRTTFFLERQHTVLGKRQEETDQKIHRIFTAHHQKLELAAVTVKYADPKQVLRRGYSITRLGGKAVRDLAVLRPGDRIETELAGGRIESEVR